MIILACDHGGYELKETIKAHLVGRGLRVDDVSEKKLDTVDYPVPVKAAVEKIKHHGLNNSRGIFVCGSGIGVSIAANRFRGIRAALVGTEVYAQLARQHNDANVLCLGGRFLEEELALRLVDVFLETPFLGGRHSGRVEMLDRLQ